MSMVRSLAVASVLALGASAQGALFQTSFNTDTANNAQTQAAYPAFTLAGAGSPEAIVTGGQLFIQNIGNNTQNFTRAGMGGDTHLSADISASNSGGNYNVGLSIGANNIVFHPGFGGAALRVEGPNGFGNTNVGFTPANGTLHHLEVDTFAQIGLFRVTLTDGDTNQSYTTSYMNPAAVGGDVGVRRGGPPNGDSRYDNLQLAKPTLVLHDLFSESFDTDAAGTPAFNLTYPQIDTSVLNGGSVSASGGNAVVSGSGANTDQLLSLGAFTGEFVVQAEVGGTSDAGSWNTGLRIGENNITFHPGHGGAALRVDGPGGFGNQNVGFTPALNDLHLLTVHALGDGRFNLFLQNAANLNQIYRNSFTNVNSIDGLVSLRRSGPTAGDALFGSVNVFQIAAPPIPEPATMGLLAVGAMGLLGRRRRQA